MEWSFGEGREAPEQPFRFASLAFSFRGRVCLDFPWLKE
jgi:hypothetical protein